MKRKLYTIDEVQIGDEILFDDTHKVEHNLFWKVVNKISQSRLIVEIKETGYAEKYNIDIQDVINLEKENASFNLL